VRGLIVRARARQLAPTHQALVQRLDHPGSVAQLGRSEPIGRPGRKTEQRAGAAEQKQGRAGTGSRRRSITPEALQPGRGDSMPSSRSAARNSGGSGASQRTATPCGDG